MTLRSGGALGVAILLGLGVVIGLWGRAEWYRREALRNALSRDSVEAVLDTTRVTLNGDIATRERRLLQVSRERDSLDRRLRRTTQLRGSLTLSTPSRDTGLRAPVEEREGIRTLRFPSTRVVPFTVAAVVTVPPPPDSASLALTLGLDPASLEVRVQCGEARGGVRPATLLLRGPSWLTLVVDSAQQAPTICQSDLKVPTRHGAGHYLLRGGVAVGLVAAIAALLR